MNPESLNAPETYNIHVETVVKASPARVYEAWLDSEAHSEMIGRVVQGSPQVGGTFLRGGVHSGVIVELIPGKRIVEAWRHRDWKEGDFSLLTLTFEQDGNGTKIILDHRGIPFYFQGRLEKGWGETYLPSVRKYFGGS
ncbi:MAG TPA: SRPBCC domain-containing protein [Nitrososphaerales archaeon]|nr:SRPBCC domain-containing protein [Nitrososphaerales archaeon]